MTTAGSNFGGDRKQGEWFLATAERRMVNWLVPRVPGFLETYHPTLMTLLWSAGIVVGSYLARQSLHWLWLVSAFIFLQYISDVLDGAVGRYRDTGLIKWGFYMDHFLDYVFLASIIGGYGLLPTEVPGYWFLALIALGGAFMVNMFLSFAATNEFQISVLQVGPTEMRLFFILVNTGIIFFGTGWFAVSIPYVAAGFTVALVWTVFRTQQQIWRLDMDLKRSRSL
ncbi:MAG: CDP-alcohol phosphatidyltransferase family protein [Dehalococcoidia bacterium]